MNELAGAPARSRRRAPQREKPYLQRVHDRVDAPAIVMTPTHDILAWNPLAAALMVDFGQLPERERNFMRDRKSTRLNSSHRCISYAVFCLKKKKKKKIKTNKQIENKDETA